MTQTIMTGGAGDDLLDASAFTTSVVLRGLGGHDTLLGGSAADRIDGGGGGGGDLIDAGAGNDTIFIFRDNLVGGLRDTINGGAGIDELIITISSYQMTPTVKSELARLTTFLADAVPGANFVSDVFHIDMTGVERARVRLDGVLQNLPDLVPGPQTVADSYAATEDTTLSVNAANGLLANDSAPAGGLLAVAGTFGTALGGSVTIAADGSFTYNPAANVNGADSFVYTVQDAVGRSVTGTTSIAVAAVNDAASIGGTSTGSVTEDGTLFIGGQLTISDPDAGQAAFQTPASLAGTYGSFTFNAATGAWGYTLANAQANVQGLVAGQQVTDTLTVSSLDGSASRAITVTINGAADGLPPGAVLNPDNGHYYFKVNTSVTWSQALAAAETTLDNGMKGYLATITSDAENQFVANNFTGIFFLGGSDAQTEGTWKWVAGPEAGTTFFIKGAASQPGFSSWGPGEPNDQFNSEDNLEFGQTGFGKWNDLPDQVFGFVIKYPYLVEYSFF